MARGMQTSFICDGASVTGSTRTVVPAVFVEKVLGKQIKDLFEQFLVKHLCCVPVTTEVGTGSEEQCRIWSRSHSG